MIIRKPYAFLIKNFKKIHILLFILSIYIYAKNTQVFSFIREFMDLGTYDAYNKPITNYASGLSLFAMLLLIIGSTCLILLLKHKDKPWKLYLIPLIEYCGMFLLYLWIRSYFATYTGTTDTTITRMFRDFLFIVSAVEIPIFGIFIMRIFGVDVRKFNFELDKEYLELSSEDREEFEINIDIDKETFKRGTKRLLRNINYIYQEHKFVCNIIAAILLVILLRNTYVYIFITNKSYTQGEALNANGYTITINDSYFTDKDFKGKVISKDSNFVVIDLTVQNNSSRREIDTSKFHVMNGVNNYISTGKTYETEFQDFGSVYQVKELKNGEKTNFILIFKVDKKLQSNKFVLFYQELDKKNPYLRKIKLKIKDVSKIENQKKLSLGDKMKFEIKKKSEYLIIDDIDVKDNTTFSYKNCTTTECSTYEGNVSAPEGYKILEIMLSSNNYEGKDIIDFSTNYGKIKYIDSNGKDKSKNIENVIRRSYYGKYLYVKIPDAAASSEKLSIVYTIRNKKYTYELK